MRRLLWALLVDLFSRIADGAAYLSGQGERNLAQHLQTFLTAANQFLVAVEDGNDKDILHSNGEAIESLASPRRLARQMPQVRKQTAMGLDARLEARIAAALEQNTLPADIDTVGRAVVAYSAYVLPAPVCDAYFEHLWRADEEQLREDILQLRTIRERGWNERVGEMARAAGLAAGELRARRDATVRRIAPFW